MPLLKGRSDEIIQRNIAELIKAGHKPAQAEAIAYREAGRGAGETYIDVLRQANQMENDAIAIGLRLISLAPPDDISQLIEITGDENDHSRIYSALLSRYESDTETPGEDE